MAKEYQQTIFIDGRNRTYEEGLEKRALKATDPVASYNGVKPVGTTKFDPIEGSLSDYWSPSWGARQYGKMFYDQAELEEYRSKCQAAIFG